MKNKPKNTNDLNCFDETFNILTANEIFINYRHAVKPSTLPKITTSRDVVKILRAIWSDRIEHIEEFFVVCLNRSNRLLCWSKVSSGGVSGTIVDAKIIFQIGLKSNATAIILAHNHPSGNLQPSESDIRLTKRISEVGLALDLRILDHIIISSEGFYSFADEGLL